MSQLSSHSKTYMNICIRTSQLRKSSSNRRINPVLSDQSGQGVLEYILILVIVVAIAFGVLYQFNGAFAKWAVSYFGSYLACLMETGELPGIGGSEGDRGECSQLYANFTFTKGIPYQPPGSGGSGGSSGSSGSKGGSSTRPTQGSEGSGGQSRTSGRASYSKVGGGGRRAGNWGRNNSFGLDKKNDRSSGRGGMRGAEEGDLYTGSTVAGLPGGGLNGQRQKIKSRQSGLVGGLYLSPEGEEKKKKTIVGKVKTKKNIHKGRGERMKIARKIANKEQTVEEEEITLGNFLRLLIIAGIVIALFILLSGQALQISKSWE